MAMQYGTRAYSDRSVTKEKIEALTVSRAMVTDASGNIAVATTTATELGYVNGVTSAIQTQLDALASGYSRRRAVKAVVNNTVAPPTEVSGDRYILDNTAGGVHADWDGALINQIVEFNGSVWVATAPLEGYVAYDDALNIDWLYVDDGTPVWQQRATQSNALASANIWVGNGSGIATAAAMSGNVTIDNTGATTVAASILNKPNYEEKTLIAGDITAQYIDLAKLITAGSLHLKIIGLPTPRQGTDYTLSTEGGVTRITFAGALATAGACALIAGDILECKYLWTV